jgi:glycosyltransferase involved in cell wall biosynthesis
MNEIRNATKKPHAAPVSESTPLERNGRAAVIVFLVTEDWYFWSHRLPLARAARAAGARVIIASRVEKLRGEIEREGFEPVALPWRRRSHNPWNEVRAFLAIVALYRRERPDIVHHVAIKPVVYGSMAARVARVSARINAIAGLGYVETSRQPRARVLRGVFNSVLRVAWSAPGVHVIVQNPDDREALARTGLVPSSHIHMIRGSGVDVVRFAPSPEPPSPPVRVVYGGRLLWSKGIRELVEAARALKQRGVPVEVILAGDPDVENPESIPAADVQTWVREGSVSHVPWGSDMAATWRGAHIAVLPSYREGLPKALLEAAACGRPLVATDVPGCREIARDGVNALLVPPRDAPALVSAIEKLALDAPLRARFALAGREIVVNEYAESIVVNETLALYRSLCATETR